jgi:hypothetical protein
MKNTLPTLALLALSSLAADTPLVSLDFEADLANAGTLGGSARLHAYAPGEEPGFGVGPFGRCLDLTAAARHGGTTPQDAPAGGAALFKDPALDALDAFTLVLWARQNPLTPGSAPARLLHKPGAWDLIPHASGLTLSLGADPGKTTYALSGTRRLTLTDDWCFFAVAVAPQSVAAYTGSRKRPLALAAGAARTERTRAAPGELALGNFGGIRPFNGWLDRVRVFHGTLDEAALRALFDADLASAKDAALPAVTELARLPTPDARPPAHAAESQVSSFKFRLPPSAIPFSTRWARTNALDVMRSFHATHCLWVYGSETGFLRRVQGAGLFYQGTLNGLQGDRHSTTNRANAGDATGRHEDLDGNKNTPHWMVTFGPRIFTGCCNHPAFRKCFFDDAQQLVAAGVDSLHVDDWEMNASWVRSAGVCFCGVCRSGFRQWLGQRYTAEELKRLGVDDLAAFDYRAHLKACGVPDAATYRSRYRTLPLTPAFADYQIESMRAFFKEFRRRLDAWSPDKHIPVSVNGLLTPLRPDHVLYGVDVIDFLHGESSQNAEYQTAAEFIFGAKIAEAAGLTQVISPIPRGTARTRAAIATTYALGQPHLVPWDLYMGSDATGIQPRYFGTREQYGDLYDFVSAQRGLLDSVTSASEIGVLINGDEPGAYQDYCLRLAARQIPFRIILGANRYARVPVRAGDLRGLRLLVELSPASTFCADDQATLNAARATGLTRFAPAAADIPALCRARELELLRVEGPENVYAFLRVDRERRTCAIHVVNWNLGGPDTERAETYANVTVTLLHPERWGALSNVVWLEPGQPTVTLSPERHADGVRLTLPRLSTWGVLLVAP